MRRVPGPDLDGLTVFARVDCNIPLTFALHLASLSVLSPPPCRPSLLPALSTPSSTLLAVQTLAFIVIFPPLFLLHLPHILHSRLPRHLLLLLLLTDAPPTPLRADSSLLCPLLRPILLLSKLSHFNNKEQPPHSFWCVLPAPCSLPETFCPFSNGNRGPLPITAIAITDHPPPLPALIPLSHTSEY